MNIEDYVGSVAREHMDAVEKLTMAQFEKVLMQALLSGDFVRHIQDDSQCVCYLPYARKNLLEDKVAHLECAMEMMAKELFAIDVDYCELEMHPPAYSSVRDCIAKYMNMAYEKLHATAP